MAKSIGQIHCEASTAKMVELGIPLDTIWTWEEMKPGDGQAPAEAGAKAVLLYALDLMAAAGVTPAEAAVQLRAGKTIEEVCARRSLTEEQRQKNAEFLAMFNGPDMAEGGDNGR